MNLWNIRALFLDWNETALTARRGRIIVRWFEMTKDGSKFLVTMRSQIKVGNYIYAQNLMSRFFLLLRMN